MRRPTHTQIEISRKLKGLLSKRAKLNRRSATAELEVMLDAILVEKTAEGAENGDMIYYDEMSTITDEDIDKIRWVEII